MESGRHHYAWLGDLHEKAAIPSGRQIEEDAFIAHLHQLFVGYFVAMLDRVNAGFDGGLNADGIDGMGGNLEVLTVCLFDHRRQCRE